MSRENLPKSVIWIFLLVLATTCSCLTVLYQVPITQAATVLTEDFENWNSNNWTVVGNASNTVMIAVDAAYSSSYGLQCLDDSSSANRITKDISSYSLTDHTITFRFRTTEYSWFNNAVWRTLFLATDSAENYLFWIAVNGSNQFMCMSDVDATYEEMMGTIQTNQWYSFRLNFEVAVSGSVQLYINNVLEYNLTADTSSWQFDGDILVGPGNVYASPSDTYELHYDDVVLSNTVDPPLASTIYAYVASFSDNALSIFDVTDPTTPTLEGSIQGSGSPNYLGGADSVYVVGNLAYVTGQTDHSLSIFNVTDPTTPTLEGSIQGSGSPNYLGNARGIYVVGNYAYVSAWADNALTIINVTDPTTPTHEGTISGSGSPNYLALATDVYVVNDLAYVAAYNDDALSIFNVTDPTTPTHEGTISGSGSPNYLNSARNVNVNGDLAYVVAADDDALSIFNVTDPTTPTLEGSISGAGNPNYLNGAWNIHVVGNYAYVSAWADNALTIINVTDPTTPTHEGTISGSGSPNYLGGTRGGYVLGNYAYFTSWSNDALSIFNVTDPTTPTHEGFISGSGSPNYLNSAHGIFVVSIPTYEINIASSPEMNVDWELDGSPYTSPWTSNIEGDTYAFECTELEVQINSSYKYTFDYWSINASGAYYSASMTIIIGGDTNLTMHYLGSSLESPITPTFTHDAENATWYLRSDTHTINTVLGYKLDIVNTQVAVSDSRTTSGTHNISYGIRVWAWDIFNNTYELSGGSPEAVVTRSSDAQGIQSAYFSCPAVITLVDAIQINVYQRFDSDPWSLRRYFITDDELYYKFPAGSWIFYYYTNRTVSSTTSYLFHGSTTYSSSISLQYYRANPWEIALAMLQDQNYLGFFFIPWIYYFGDMFWSVALLFCVVTAYTRWGSIKPILAILWIFGGAGSVLSALIPAIALNLAWLMLAVAIGLTFFKLIYR